MTMVKEQKLAKVKELKKTISGYSVLGLIDMHKAATKQVQKIRKGLEGKAVIMMTKKSTLLYALEAIGGESMKQLEGMIPKQPAILLTNEDPFKFYVNVKSLRFKTFAKKGDKPAEDIWVFAGPTSLLAGPAISDFQGVGLVAGVEAGKIAIKKDALFVKAGEEIDIKKANILRKLNIEPVEVTLNVMVLSDKGGIFGKDSLEMSLAYPTMLPKAYNSAINLSVFIEFPTKENMKQLLMKAVRSANAVSGLASKSEVQGQTSTETAVQPSADAAQSTGGVS
jgi:large subunit ribosomal protein L10